MPSAWAHDIPNERIDRSIQVSLSPGSIAIDYEVSLTELTLTQDLRRLIGSLPGADRQEWLDSLWPGDRAVERQGHARLGRRRAGPAGHEQASTWSLKTTLVTRFTWRDAFLTQGRLRVRDTNYVSSEGTSRLAIRGQAGVVVTGDSLPTDVAQIEIRPVWILSDAEERRTKQVEVEYRVPGRTVR